MVFLWSDYFVYSFFIIAFYTGLRMLKNKNAIRKWQTLLYRPLNLVAVMILMVYATIALLDSIHFKVNTVTEQLNNSGVASVLDKILLPLIDNSERTYSAPFAIYSFNKETIVTTQGQMLRQFPRLIHAGSHVMDEKYKQQDINNKLSHAIVTAIIIWVTCSVGVLFIACLKHHLSFEEFIACIFQRKNIFPWKTLLVFMGVMILALTLLFEFMPYYHILGTDQVGKDVLYQSLKSIRTGLLIGTLTTLFMLPFALLFGTLAGYFGGLLDDIIQYLYTTLSAVPGVLLMAAAVLAMQIIMEQHANLFPTALARADARLLALCAILGITSWTSLCRLMRGEALKIAQMDYVQAAHCLGVSHFKIILTHLIPNVMHIILISIVLDFSGLVLAEAVLSYVGVGVDPTSFSWGTMINSARLEMARIPVVWWNLFAAFILMFILVLSANIFSDAIRDGFDPHYNRRLT